MDRALDAELSRVVSQLKEPGYPPPYYVSLTAIDSESWERRCEMGAPTYAGEREQRLILPDVRVGSYDLDNHPMSPPTGFAGRAVAFSADEFALRHELWRMLDAAYKNASADFLRKQALRVSRGKTEYDTDDFSRERPRRGERERPASLWDKPALERLCASASAAFRGAPALLGGEASVRLNRHWSRLRDSEGSRVDFGRDLAEIELEASDAGADGMRHFATRRWAIPSPYVVPSSSEVLAQAKDMIEDLELLRVAATTSPFSAPALIDPSVSAAIVLSLGLRLSGEEQRNPGGSQTFRGKQGRLVLPENLTVVDDPRVPSFFGASLAGHYEFDDQGVPAQAVTLFDKGVLSSYLLSRYPVIGFPRSNGHGRAFPGYWPEGLPGNLFLQAKKTYTPAELLLRLRQECLRQGKPYGLWVRKLRNFVQQQATESHGSIRLMPSLVYLVNADTGEMTLVRDLDLVGTPIDLVSDIVAAGNDFKAQNISFGAPISVVAPSLLLHDAELQRSEGRPERPPILPPPQPASEPPIRPARVPTIPVVPHVQVVRYILKDAGSVEKPPVSGLVDFRERRSGRDLIIDAKLSGPSLPAAGAAVKRMDDAVAGFGHKLVKSVLAPMMPETAYRARYGAGWP